MLEARREIEWHPRANPSPEERRAAGVQPRAKSNMTTEIQSNGPPGYLVASDFDQTLSFNDSGYVLSEMLGISDFQKKVAGLSRSNLVHQGAELAYLLRHDPEFRSVRREHLVEAGRRVRLKDN